VLGPEAIAAAREPELAARLIRRLDAVAAAAPQADARARAEQVVATAKKALAPP
jgi:hypothetical protein